MSAAASAVVRVSVRGSQTFLTSDGMTILTDYQMAVVDVVKGSNATPVVPGHSITVRRLGGVMTIEGRRVFSNESGFAPFANDAEYVLFLKTGSTPSYELVAGSRSAFRVHQGTVIGMSSTSEVKPLLPLTRFVDEVRGKGSDVVQNGLR
jgi:hypothetical protein